MSDRIEDRDGTFRWAKECPDRYEVTLYFSNDDSYTAPKYVKEIICTDAEKNKMTLKDYIWTKPKELERLLYNRTLDNLVDVKVYDKNDYMEHTLQRFVDRSVKKYLDKKNTNYSSKQKKLPESQGHIQIKQELVEYLRRNGIEAYPEVVFYENAPAEFYAWQRQELRSKSNIDGIFGFGNVGFGHYKQNYGQQVRVDVAGWIDDPHGKFNHPVIAVEVMKSSNLREEIMGLRKILGSVIYAVVVDAVGLMRGQVNGIPVIPHSVFQSGVILKLIEMVRVDIMRNESPDRILDLGKKFNIDKLD